MSKLSAETFVSLLALVDAGKTIQLEKLFNGDYEMTVFENPKKDPYMSHSHYTAGDLISAIEKAKD